VSTEGGSIDYEAVSYMYDEDTAVAHQHWTATKTTSYDRTYVFSFELEGEEEPETWSAVEVQCWPVSLSKPARILDLSATQQQVQSGNGTAEVYCRRRTGETTAEAEGYVNGYVEDDDRPMEDQYASLAYLFAGAPSFQWCSWNCMKAHGITSYANDVYYYNEHDYTIDNTSQGIDQYFGSILSENEFALIYSDSNDLYSTHYYAYGTDENIDYASTRNYGPASVYIDGVDMVFVPHDASRERVTLGNGVKYFQHNGKSIGLFFVCMVGSVAGARDYLYIYAEVDQETGESKLITTYFGTDMTGQVPGVTDDSGNPVYGNGRGGFRLIK
jgi:hypothetical protein